MIEFFKKISEEGENPWVLIEIIRLGGSNNEYLLVYSSYIHPDLVIHLASWIRNFILLYLK